MYAGADQHTVRHTWTLDTEGRGLCLKTCLKDARAKGGWAKPSTAYVDAFENALSKMAKEKAHEVMHKKREWAKNKGIAQKGLKGGVDSAMMCPVLLAISAQRPNARTRTADGSEADPEVRHVFVFLRESVNSSSTGRTACVPNM